MKDIRIKLFSPHSTDTSSVTLWNCSVSAKASERAYRQMKLNIQFPLYNESSITRLLAAHKRPINANENWNIKKKTATGKDTKWKAISFAMRQTRVRLSRWFFFKNFFFSFFSHSVNSFNFANSCSLAFSMAANKRAKIVRVH